MSNGPDAEAAGRRVGRNVTVMAGGQLITWTMTLLWTLVVPRSLGPSGMGTIMTAWSVTGILGVVLGLLAVAHVATRRLAPAADGILLPLAALLNGIGYVFIARLDHKLAGLQAMWTALGIGAFVGTLFVVRRVRDLERFRYTFALIGIGLLLMPLLPVVGRNINGARLWVRLGGISFQPGEFAKVALCIFLASYLVE